MVVTVLASGGLDSTTCIAHYMRNGFDVAAIWVNYGQPAAIPEKQAVHNISSFYQIPLTEVSVVVPWRTRRVGLVEYQARNLTLAALATNTAQAPGLISFGIHAGTDFTDCSPSFTHSLDELMAIVSEGQLRLDCPFLTWSKYQLVQYAKVLQVPVKLTYSCETGTIPPCGECVKCRDLEMCFKGCR